MSFSAKVKKELSDYALGGRCCALSECMGILLYCNTFRRDQIRIVTENEDFAALLPRLFRKAFGLSFDSLPGNGSGGKLVFTITDSGKLRTIFDSFGYSAEGEKRLNLNYGVFEDDGCPTAFLRGAFLSGGSVTDPEKRYHLELSTTHPQVSRETHALMLELELSPKETGRGGSSVLYFKQSNAIEDFLTTVGAPICAMAIMEAKVEKELVNGVNRRVNCETANLTKVVDAAQEQLLAIRKLRESGRFETLPEKLKESAILREENPEATLTELSEMTEPPVSKSAMNHRMRKLTELSRE